MPTKLIPINVYGLLEKNIGNFRKHTLNFAASLSLFNPVNLFVETKDHDEDIESYINIFDNIKIINHFDIKSERNIYLLANNPPHRFLLEFFIKKPGAVVFHDINLFWLLKQVFTTKEILIDEQLERRVELIEMAINSLNPRISSLAIHGIYFNKYVVDKALGSFVHSRHGTYSLKLKARKKSKIFEINIPNNNDIYNSIISNKYNLIATKLLPINISIFGYMSPYKNVYEFLLSLKNLRSGLIKNINIHIIGSWESNYKNLCEPLIKDLSKFIKITLADKYISNEDLKYFYSKANLIINLRYPTCGESSGILSETKNLNTIFLVTNIGSFIHSENVIKVDIGKSMNDYVKNITDSLQYAIKLCVNKNPKLTDSFFMEPLKIYGREIYSGIKSMYE